jgi:hypothetical protein
MKNVAHAGGEINLQDESRWTLDARLDDLGGVFGSLMNVYPEHEFDCGYERARQDLLASLVPIAEQYLRQDCGHSAEARRDIYGFIDFLERHIERASQSIGYVTGGLGI